ncbi:pseudaminic acid biosynthesis-associated protein [Bacillus sp. TS-2]|nr:pseudaminic acid biosynthesis-associated protein [Bacillus sp. TS-2]
MIRVDASSEIGTGHVMRCLTLAHLLKQQGAIVTFICCELPGNMNVIIKELGFSLQTLPYEREFNQNLDARQTIQLIEKMKIEKIDWIVIDHYQIANIWEKQLKPYSNQILVIDDLANRSHDCDVLLDQNYYIDMAERYLSLVPTSTKLLLGPTNLLLRDEFIHNNIAPKKFEKIRRFLIFYGGSDPTNETEKVLQAFKKLSFSDIKIDVIVGQSNLNKKRIEELALEIGATFYCQIDFISDLMSKADISFGAGGVTMWERCYLGLPSVVTIVVENQELSTEAAAKFGAIFNLGNDKNITAHTYAEFINELVENPIPLNQMSERALQLVKREKSCEQHPLISLMFNE